MTTEITKRIVIFLMFQEFEAQRKITNERSKRYYRENRSACMARMKLWVANNRDRMRYHLRRSATKRGRAKGRLTWDQWRAKVAVSPEVQRLRRVARRRLSQLVHCRHGITTVELIGCSVNYLKSHLESRWKPEWDWDNYGKVWVVDHVLPIKLFDLSNPLHVSMAFHWTNLQPLGFVENSLKSDKVPVPVQPELPLAYFFLPSPQKSFTFDP